MSYAFTTAHPDLERIWLRMALYAGKVNFDKHGPPLHRSN
jgi:hypothetical protein